MTDGGGQGEDDTEEGENDRIGMKIANDNPKLSFPLLLCHSCSFSVIPAKAGIQGRCAVVGAASHAARRGRQETDSAMR